MLLADLNHKRLTGNFKGAGNGGPMGVLPSRWKGTLGTPGSRTLGAWELNSLVGRVIVLQPANCGLWSLGFLRVLVGPERDVGEGR